MLSAYGEIFDEGAVQSTGPEDKLSYRFYERRPFDVLQIAVEAGLLEPNNPLVLFLNSWSTP